MHSSKPEHLAFNIFLQKNRHILDRKERDTKERERESEKRKKERKKRRETKKDLKTGSNHEQNIEIYMFLRPIQLYETQLKEK